MGDTPLHVAASHGHLSVIDLLLEAGCDTTLKNSLGYVAEELACEPAVKNAIQLNRRQTFHNYNEDDYNDESD